MLSRVLAFLVWAGVAASAVAWGMRLFATPSAVPAQAALAAAVPPPQGDLTRLFGAAPVAAVEAAPAAPPPNNRFQLLGVVAARGAATAKQAVALIAVDGKPPRVYRVGSAVDGDNILQSVERTTVAIGPRGGVALISLQLPPLPPPATGTLPSVTSATPVIPPPVASPPMIPPAQAPVVPPTFPGVAPFQSPGAAVAPQPLPVQPGTQPQLPGPFSRQVAPLGNAPGTTMPMPAPFRLPLPAPASQPR